MTSYDRIVQARREASREKLTAALVASGGSVRAAASALRMATNYFYTRAKIVGLDIDAVRALATFPTSGHSLESTAEPL